MNLKHQQDISRKLKVLGHTRDIKNVAKTCRYFGICRETFYKWREKYGGMEASDVKRLKELEDENRRLKQMYADLSLHAKMQEEIIKKL
jgi:putative transposase